MRARRFLRTAAAAASVTLGLTTSTALAGNDVVIDFEVLATAGNGLTPVGETYSEDGFTINGSSLNSFQLSEFRFAGSTGLLENTVDATIELVKSDGGAFRLASIDLDPLNDNGNPTTVTFVGELGGMQVAMQTITTSTSLTFETFNLNADFANVDRVTWEQTISGGDFHQFDDIVLTPPMTTVIDFESLAQAGTGIRSVGPAYAEDGFTINGTNLSSFRLDDGLFAGSTGMFDFVANATIELVKDDGGAFRLAAIDLSRLNTAVAVTAVTFTGHLDGSPVASQMFTTTTDLAFQSFVFNADFANVDRVTWVQQDLGAGFDFHQFDDIVLAEATATILESATLGATGQVDGTSVSAQFLGARFSLDEPARITEIGGHLIVFNNSIWGAIIPLSGPGALPPFGFDVEANALAHALFDGSGILNESQDLCQPVDAVLPAGHYALVFGGGGLFGSTGVGSMPGNNTDTPEADYFFRTSGGTWMDGGFNKARFVVRGTPIPCTNCVGDANDDMLVNFGDVTTVLGNWLAVCPTDETLVETATLGATGQGGGIGLGFDQILGARFSVSEPTRITGMGGHIETNAAGTVWGAIIPLSGPNALPPGGFDLEGEALASALFSSAENSSEDLLEPVDVVLLPGDYALLFGGNGLFGSTDSGSMPDNNTDIGTPSYFFSVNNSASWVDGGFSNARFVVVGEPLCSTCEGDANFSGDVNFADVTTVLGNWLSVCP